MVCSGLKLKPSNLRLAICTESEWNRRVVCPGHVVNFPLLIDEMVLLKCKPGASGRHCWIKCISFCHARSRRRWLQWSSSILSLLAQAFNRGFSLQKKRDESLMTVAFLVLWWQYLEKGENLDCSLTQKVPELNNLGSSGVLQLVENTRIT